MNSLTKEQHNYITYNKIKNTKLISIAGSGKTRCIIYRINYLIESKLLSSDEILMLTFSRFTRDDFLNRIKLYGIQSIDSKNIKTIDSFAKSLIDEKNEIDVSLLSFKFKQYLENSSSEDIQQNKKLQSIKTIFVDEAQDLNYIQYKILVLLNEKNGTYINLIGDPNQNIYQFRKSSDKYLMEFNAKTFYLTQNFRSYNSVLNFSSCLRPIKEINGKEIKIKGNLGEYSCLPQIYFHKTDNELETSIINILKLASNNNIDLSDIAILSPTRGRMKGLGNSHGLCLVSNLLYKHKYKFKQFYEEINDEQTNNIKYEPIKNHVNLLTYMGSKGLEWKIVILIDADICLINKRHFSEEKHKHDQYLLYVACSRAIENLIIFSKYQQRDGLFTFKLNTWFDTIPKDLYEMDTRFECNFKYSNLQFVDKTESEKKIIKILERFDEETLNCLFEEITNAKFTKTVTKIYDKDYSCTINSNIFLVKYIKHLFIVYYQLKNNMEKNKYMDVENIINDRIITNVSYIFSEWFYINKNDITWDTYNRDKHTFDKQIVETIDKKFDKSQPIQNHTIINDGYFKSFILSMKESIKENYNKYLKSTNKNNIKKYLFNID